MSTEFAIQSYCFRAFSENSQVASLVKECGSREIELCAVHADFSDETAFDDIIDTYQNAGVRIISIGVENISTDEKEARKRFEFLKKAGASYMSVDFSIAEAAQSIQLAEKLADEYDVYLGIHNHGGLHWLGVPSALNNVFQNSGKRIGLSLDTAWALHSHADPIKMAEDFSQRLYLTHLKDFVFDRAGNPQDVVCGEGSLNIPRLSETLSKNSFEGPLIVEYEGDVEDPAPEIKKCIERLRQDWV